MILRFYRQITENCLVVSVIVNLSLHFLLTARLSRVNLQSATALLIDWGAMAV